MSLLVELLQQPSENTQLQPVPLDTVLSMENVSKINAELLKLKLLIKLKEL